MEKARDWNPMEYLRFRNERTQPSIDLVNRIRMDRPPRTILDIGCGPGNSSQVLLERWPDARLTGVDNSPAMIEKAQRNFPHQEWILADASEYVPPADFDLVFSNAAIQWIPNHRALIAKMAGMLSAEGVLAFQVPRFNEMAISRIIDSVCRSKRWRKATERCARLFAYHDAGFYYDLLSGQLKSVDIWETAYYHIMESHLSIVEWLRSTAIRPYLDAIGSENDAEDFEADLLDGIKRAYHARSDGRVFFPFKRLFFIGLKLDR